MYGLSSFECVCRESSVFALVFVLVLLALILHFTDIDLVDLGDPVVVVVLIVPSLTTAAAAKRAALPEPRQKDCSRFCASLRILALCSLRQATARPAEMALYPGI